jgi:hypothetical protein
MPDQVRGDFTLDQRPMLRPGTARALHRSHLLLGSETLGRVAALDPIAAVIAGSLDGGVTLADLGDDVAAAADLPTAEGRRLVLSLVGHLDRAGFVDGALPDDVEPRRRDFPVPATSCLGQRFGLSRSRTIQVPGRVGFRVSSTVPALLDRIEVGLARTDDLGVVDDADVDTLHLRAAPGPGRRIHQLFDTLDRLWWAGHDLDAAVEALERSVEARLALRDGTPFLQGPSFEFDDRLVLVHPALWEQVSAAPVRRTTGRHGVVATPGGLLRAEVAPDVDLIGDRFAGRPTRRLRPVAVLVPEPVDDIEFARQSLHLLRSWNRRGFRALLDLIDHVDQIAASDDLGADIVDALTG